MAKIKAYGPLTVHITLSLCYLFAPCLLSRRYYRGEACLSVASSYRPTAALPRTGSLPVSSEAFAALLPARPAYHRASCRATTAEAKPACQ